MWHGVGAYLIFAAVTGLILHTVSSRFGACIVVGGLMCSLGNLAHEACLADWRVNPGWLPPVFAIGLVLATAAIALAGWPVVIIRQWRQRDSKGSPTN
jgi:hypothetical protein